MARNNDELICTRCHVEQESHHEIVYSQGDKVCLSCKKITQASDNIAFDRDMSLRLKMTKVT